MNCVVPCSEQDHLFHPPLCRPLSLTTSQRPKQVDGLDKSGDHFSQPAAGASSPKKRQRSKSEQAGYDEMWDAPLANCSGSHRSEATTVFALQQDRPISRSSWPGLLQLSSCFASSLLKDQPSSCNSSMCSSQTSSLSPPCSSPASHASSSACGFNRSGSSSMGCYASTPSSMCISHSNTSSMITTFTAASTGSGNSGSCWSSKSQHIQSRPAPGGELGEGISWFMPEYGGKEVLAEYEFGQMLGCGTFGVTRLVTDRKTARPWACKTICKASIAAITAAISDVQHEVAILQHLSGNKGIVQLQGVFEDERNIHLVMELCTGGDLLDYISRFGRLTESEAADIGHVMLTTLQYCHNNGVIHRDIKPENFLLGAPAQLESPAGTAAAVLKISDFGVSAFYTPNESFAEIVGTPFYMAPEVLERSYGPAADIWSVGVVIYLMIAGCLPFNGHTDRQIIKAVMDSEPDFSGEVWQETSQAAQQFLKQMLIKDPAQRATIDQLLAHPWMASRSAKLADSSTLSSTVQDAAAWSTQQSSSSHCEQITARGSSSHCEQITARGSSSHCEQITAHSSSSHCEQITAHSSSSHCEQITAHSSSSHCEQITARGSSSHCEQITAHSSSSHCEQITAHSSSSHCEQITAHSSSPSGTCDSSSREAGLATGSCSCSEAGLASGSSNGDCPGCCNLQQRQQQRSCSSSDGETAGGAAAAVNVCSSHVPQQGVKAAIQQAGEHPLREPCLKMPLLA